MIYLKISGPVRFLSGVYYLINILQELPKKIGAKLKRISKRSSKLKNPRVKQHSMIYFPKYTRMVMIIYDVL